MESFERQNDWPPSREIPQIIQLYAFADKYCMEGMCHQVLDLVRHGCNDKQLTWAHLEQAKEAGLQGSQMWKMLIERITQGGVRSDVSLTNMLQDGLDSDAETAMEILRKLAVNQLAHDELVRSNSGGWPTGDWNGGGN